MRYFAVLFEVLDDFAVAVPPRVLQDLVVLVRRQDLDTTRAESTEGDQVA